MASYGSIYRFNVLSQNGTDVSIVISKKGYAGVAHQRSLGRAPILKRERNGNILGTSLEIFAESKAGGEFAQLYTSSADEYRVEVYKNQTLQWVGFVSPELYAEPDIAPPYDVQIIATDGLGELKNYSFTQGVGPRSFGSHLNSMLENTSLNLDIEVMSQLQYYDGAWTGNTDIMSIMVDMSHMTQESCYDVLQSMLASVNACITQQAGKWYLIRESDIYNLVDRFSPVSFGSMNACSWWPIGNLSTDVVPAKKSVNLISENQYKTTVLENSQMSEDAAWEKELDAIYDEDEGAYRLPGMGSAIRQKVSFYSEVNYLLMLNISARNIGDGEDSQKLGVMVKMLGRTYQAGSEFWLLPREDRADRYLWMDTEQYIEFELPAPSASDTRSDAERIEIRIPLYKYDNRSYAYATEIEVTLFNSTGNMAMLIQECTLTQYERTAGSMITAVIGNNAREAGDEIELAFSDGEYAFPAAYVFRNAIPLAYDSEGIIKKWRTQFVEEGSYYSVMAKDYAMQVALPRLRYKGKLNVPAMSRPVIPLLFEREATYYLLDTYSYDLLNDELEVELISIPNASVALESETITDIPSANPSSSSSSGSSGGGTSGGDTPGTGGGEVTFSLASNTTNAVALTINGTTKNITAATLKTSLGLGSLAYKSSLAFSELTNKPTTLAGYGITEIVADKVTSDMFAGPTPSGATYPRFRLFQDANYLYLQAATYDGLSTGGKVTIGGMYNSNLAELRLMSAKVGIKKSPTYELDVDGQINSTNYMIGGYLNTDPTNSFQTTFFGAVDSSIFKLRLMRKGTATDGINAPYSPIFAMKTADTHSFISISYATKDKCYIGGGSGDKINWSAILFHHNMDLIPKYNNTYILGNSSFRWKEVHAVSIKIGDATITWDSSAGMLKADKGIYSTADIVAGK